MRRRPEDIEQIGIINLIRSLGGKHYTLGTRRRKGDHQGTMQTPGIGDVYGFLPPPRARPDDPWAAFWVECKAPGGRMSPDQEEFQAYCVKARAHHVVGGINAFIAWLIAGGWLRPDQVAHYRVPTVPKSTPRSARST